MNQHQHGRGPARGRALALPGLSPRSAILSADELAPAAARLIAETLSQAAAAHGRATVALAGGNTPRAVYELLAAPPLRDAVPWRQVHIFWGDERCVPPTDPQSNYRMAREALLEQVPVPAEQVHRLAGEAPNPLAAAAAYEATLRGLFPGVAAPPFDLVLLGMGEDGHTASLFPGSPALEERVRWVAAPYVPRLNAHRLTLTLPALNGARRVCFLVAGSAKAAMVRRVLAPRIGEEPLPAALVRPTAGDVIWLLDEAAAADLEG